MEKYDRHIMQVQHRQATAEYLQSRQWDYFFTATCRNERRNSMKLKGHLWHTLRDNNAAKAFIAVEPHKSCSGLHAHGLISFAGYNNVASPPGVWRNLFKDFGRSKVEVIRSAEQVSSYCAKYVTKENAWWDYEYYGDVRAWRW